METRTTTEVKVYKLILNDMRDPKIEMCHIVAFSTDYQKLVDWYNSQLAPEMWRDGRWGKVFVENSPLEWCNPAASLELNCTRPFGQGIEDQWVTIESFMSAQERLLYID